MSDDRLLDRGPSESADAASRLRFVVLGGIIGFGMALRLAALTALPIFNDEAIYGRWAQLIVERGQWLVPLSDGKMPLYYWVAALIGALVNDPLIGMRLTSALVGTVGIVGVYLVGAKLFSYKVGLVSSGLYAVIPFAVVNDRLGMPDGTLAAISPFILLAAFRCAENPSGRRYVWLTALLAAAVLVKTPGLLLFPAAVIGFLLGRKELSPNQEERVLRSMLPAMVAMAVAVAAPVLLLGFARGGGVVFGKTASFLIQPQDLIAVPSAIWWSNLTRLGQWTLYYMQWPSLVVAVGVGIKFCRGTIEGAWSRRAHRAGGTSKSSNADHGQSGSHRSGAHAYYLLSLSLLTSLGLALVASVLFSRYLALTVPFFILAVGWGVFALADAAPRPYRTTATVILVVAISIPAVLHDWRLIRAPEKFSWAADDRWQYIEGWPSGYGFDELVLFIDKRATANRGSQAPLLVATDPDLGFPGAGLELRFSRRSDIKIAYVRADRRLPFRKGPAKQGYMYILDEPRKGTADDFLRLNPGWTTTALFRKPGSVSAFRVMERAGKVY